MKLQVDYNFKQPKMKLQVVFNFKRVWNEATSCFQPVVTKAVLHFFSTGFMPKAINSSAITLVAKQSNATSMHQFRPISCCNTVYKCIAKMIAQRMRPVMSLLTSNNQGAFVPNRIIGDNVLLAQSLCKDYHLKVGQPKFSCKLDLRKAFDSISWNFILETLKRMNFPTAFISWISSCICGCMHSVKINGSLEGYFQASSGLRQGCPLSPYLFVLAMEVLNACVSHSIRNGDFQYHWRTSGINLTHLVFADDLLLFCKGECESIKLLFDGVDLFSALSGMQPNPSKCTCYFGNVDSFTKLYALFLTKFVEGTLPMHYLGLPLISGALKARHCTPLITKITNKINLWTNIFISQAGRIQLIHSVLFGIHGYWAMFLFLPSAVIKKVQSIFAKFLWKGSISGHCFYKVAWADCCYAKSEGGLGFKNLQKWNEAAVIFQLWRVITNQSSIWVQWVHAYELKRKNFWTCTIPRSCSWGWKRILTLRPLALQHLTYKVGFCSNFSLWHDPWCRCSPLLEQFDDSLRSALGSCSQDPVHSIQENGLWNLGVSNLSSIRELRELCRSILPNGSDEILWNNTRHAKLSISVIYSDIAPRNTPPPWLDLIHHPFSVPKFAITSWLILQSRLLTKDRMIYFGMDTNASCELCATEAESHPHLFSGCNYPHCPFCLPF